MVAALFLQIIGSSLRIAVLAIFTIEPAPTVLSRQSSRGTDQAQVEGHSSWTKHTREADANPRQEEDSNRRLTDPRRLQFLSGAEDELPPTRLHYVKSNEVRHDVWFQHIEDQSGAYLGVGADQNYTLIGFSRVSLVILMDIDQKVVDLHRAYEAFIRESASPEELLQRWTPEASKSSVTLLRAALVELPAARRKAVVRNYRAVRETVYRHLKRVHRRKRQVGTTWLSNPAAYQRVRDLYLSGRVRMMLGDVTGTTAMKSVVRLLNALDAQLGVVYLSNAEEFFEYSPSLVEHVTSVGLGAEGVVLRTISGKGWAHADRMWNYQVQSLRDFKTRLMEEGRPRSAKAMIRRAEKEGALQREFGSSGLSAVGCGVHECK